MAKEQMATVKKLFDAHALWLSMLIGAVGYRLFIPLKPVLPWLIFFMLFFTFCKINPLDLRLHRWHWVVLALQMALSVGVYYALMALTGNQVLAQGLMLCFIMPTATAAPIIAGKLGGSIQNLTSFTLLSNFATAIVVPVFFPIVYPAADMTFWEASWLILRRVSPLLLGPFFSAWLLRLGYKWRTKKEYVLSTRMAVVPFYLWVASIVVLTSVVTQTVLSTVHEQLTTMLWLLLASFFACLFQFGAGKLIGYKLPAPSKGRDYQDVLINPAAAPKTMAGVSSITAGQAFGQKNTSLGVWMAQTYLHPLAALGAAAYIIWQNLFNSVQLAVAARKK
jgi:BASS family bile acid:Na+ symporter